MESESGFSDSINNHLNFCQSLAEKVKNGESINRNDVIGYLLSYLESDPRLEEYYPGFEELLDSAQESQRLDPTLKNILNNQIKSWEPKTLESAMDLYRNAPDIPLIKSPYTEEQINLQIKIASEVHEALKRGLALFQEEF